MLEKGGEGGCAAGGVLQCSAVRTTGSEEESTMVDDVGVSLEGGGSMADAKEMTFAVSSW